jgi:hypothetical protein
MRLTTVLLSAVLLAALGAMAYGILGLLETGTCASGGPYVSVRECPDGTATAGLLVGAGATVYCLAAIVVAFRSFATGGFWFGALFTVLGATFLFAQLTDRVDPSGGGVGWFLGALFLLMGVGPLVAGAIGMWHERHDDDEPALFAGPYVIGTVIAQAPPAPGERR